MKWVEAVKIWNHGKRNVNTAHGWFVPKSGTKEYDEVREIMKMEKTPEHHEILSKKSERTIKRAQRKAMIARGEKPKRMRKPKEEKKEIITEEKKEEIKKEYKERNEARMSKALEQLRAFEKQIQESNMEKEKKAKALERVAKARGELESATAPIREAKAKGNFRGQIIQKQRSKFVKLLDDIDFLLSGKNSPLVKGKFDKLKDKEKAMIQLKFRIFMNLDKVTKDKVILERKESIMKKEGKADMPFVADPEDIETLKRAVKIVFDGDAPNVEEKKEVVKMEEETDSDSEGENSIEEMEKKLDKMKKNLGEWEKDAEARGVKKEVAQLKRNIKKLEKEIGIRKGSIVMTKKKYVKEHTRLIDVLEKAGEEGKEQKKELEGVMKTELPPPSTVDKLKQSKKESSPEDEIEKLITTNDDDEKRAIRKKIIKGSEVADKYKQFNKKQRLQRRDDVLLFKEFMKESNASKYDEGLLQFYDMLKDSKIVMDKQWETMKVE
jgi:hypothetical protein